MSRDHTLSHLFTFALLGGLSVAMAVLLMNSGGGLYA